MKPLSAVSWVNGKRDDCNPLKLAVIFLGPNTRIKLPWRRKGGLEKERMGWKGGEGKRKGGWEEERKRGWIIEILTTSRASQRKGRRERAEKGGERKGWNDEGEEINQ